MSENFSNKICKVIFHACRCKTLYFKLVKSYLNPQIHIPPHFSPSVVMFTSLKQTSCQSMPVQIIQVSQTRVVGLILFCLKCEIFKDRVVKHSLYICTSTDFSYFKHTNVSPETKPTRVCVASEFDLKRHLFRVSIQRTQDIDKQIKPEYRLFSKRTYFCNFSTCKNINCRSNTSDLKYFSIA